MPETIKLRNPITFEGETVSALTLDLENLTGSDLIAAEREVSVAKTGNFNVVNEMCKDYQAAVAARAAHQPVEMIYQLKARDFAEVTLRVQGFLLGMEDSPQDGTSE